MDIRITEEQGRFLAKASFDGAEISAIGDNKQESVLNLYAEIWELYYNGLIRVGVFDLRRIKKELRVNESQI